MFVKKILKDDEVLAKMHGRYKAEEFGQNKSSSPQVGKQTLLLTKLFLSKIYQKGSLINPYTMQGTKNMKNWGSNLNDLHTHPAESADYYREYKAGTGEKGPFSQHSLACRGIDDNLV